MPNIIVKIPTGVLDDNSRAALMRGIHAAAAQAECIPDEPAKRFLCWVVVEEVAAASWTCGATQASAGVVPVMVLLHVPAGVLAQANRLQYMAGIHRAVAAALAGQPRRCATSCVFNEVADGHWGVNGEMWRLPRFAREAGYTHLEGLVDPVVSPLY